MEISQRWYFDWLSRCPYFRISLGLHILIRCRVDILLPSSYSHFRCTLALLWNFHCHTPSLFHAWFTDKKFSFLSHTCMHAHVLWSFVCTWGPFSCMIWLFTGCLACMHACRSWSMWTVSGSVQWRGVYVWRFWLAQTKLKELDFSHTNLRSVRVYLRWPG